ncbi:MAG: OmpH family outer membrane protein [Bacteroidales bacterium]|jgi:outer membrane protein|nr:OmpH family outer membrane protein [Bacteroidales bacterium]
MTTEDQNMSQEEILHSEVKPAGRKIGFSTWINLVLFLGLIVLYALYFTGIRGKEAREEVAGLEAEIEAGTAQIAYISSDSLMAHYELAKKMRDDFDAEQTKLENDLSRRQRNFQSEVEKFQRDIQAGSISMELAQAKEQELMQVQQEIYQLNESFSSRLMEKEMEMNKELLDKITEFLSRYNEDQGYDYILGFSRGGGILYAKEKYDITNDVLQKLNQEYSESLDVK